MKTNTAVCFVVKYNSSCSPHVQSCQRQINWPCDIKTPKAILTTDNIDYRAPLWLNNLGLILGQQSQKCASLCVRQTVKKLGSTVSVVPRLTHGIMALRDSTSPQTEKHKIGFTLPTSISHYPCNILKKKKKILDQSLQKRSLFLKGLRRPRWELLNLINVKYYSVIFN